MSVLGSIDKVGAGSKTGSRQGRLLLTGRNSAAVKNLSVHINHLQLCARLVIASEVDSDSLTAVSRAWICSNRHRSRDLMN